jgi:hypothetical protein
MHRNEASHAVLEDQVNEIPMEARIARIESDVVHMREDIGNIHLDLRDLRGDMKAANDSIAELKGAVVGLIGSISTLDAKVDARIHGLETKIIKWIIGTVLASATLAFSIARFVI